MHHEIFFTEKQISMEEVKVLLRLIKVIYTPEGNYEEERVYKIHTT